MHLVVTNIPSSFRSSDLRNFFSEYVEKETFSCFHFRHRPQSHLSQLLKDCASSVPKAEADLTSSSTSSSSTTNLKGNKTHQEDGSETQQEDGSEKNVETNLILEESVARDSEDDGCGVAAKTHWLNSGLSGLSTLISEKKQRAKTDMKQNLQAIYKREQPVCRSEIKDNSMLKEHGVSEGSQPSPSQEDDVVLTERENYKTRRQLDSESLSVDTSLDLIEFCPPPIMPQGNVGTPTSYFKNLIRTCQLPGTIIKKLGLEFPKSRGQKRFSQVPFNYGTSVTKREMGKDAEGITFTAAGDLIPTSADFTKPRRKKKERKQRIKGPKIELESEREDGAEIEEWERYEAFHDDVTSQDRIKERLYEKEIELVWEKGGPGLVFYTDAQYWREQEGDFDEQTADEWDVDMSVYYEEGAGDRDAQDSVAMLHSHKLRSGKLSHSAFTKTGCQNERERKLKNTSSSSARSRKIGPAAPPPIGKFEAHTLGFGRRLLEAQGWQDGQGLGKDAVGLPYALDNDGQHPHDKKGFGYYGKKLQGWGQTSATIRQQSQRPQRQQRNDIHISTVFDRPQEEDPPPPTLRTHEPTTLTHRHNYVSFNKASDSKL
ncbi:G patch domain-containing protein 3-like [Homarus americanus]|uniref:G patch domain-containing protein 3-like n=1 Tax=Homarus americanus TaxID=6706 RepID=A0A8J5MVM6_HOMAM|nr:G patch domain-containing protein 3-like [Homarus americanus]